jgi:transmembrane sensor
MNFMPEKQFHIDWEQLIAILEKPESERQALSIALSEDEREILLRMRQLKEDPLLAGALELDVAAAWKNTRQQMQGEEGPAPVHKYSFYWKRWVAAACFFVLATAGWLLWRRYRTGGDGYETVARGLAGHLPSGTVQLVTGEGRTVEVAAGRQLQEKDGTIIQLRQGTVNYYNDSMRGAGNGAVHPHTATGEETLVNTLIVPRGFMHSLVLSDGSKVWMNADSRIRFPVRFNQRERRVEIEGEAYFEVVHDAAWPFIVKIDPFLGAGGNNSSGNEGKEVRVLGTSFDVRAYGPDIFTTLASGRVQFQDPSGNVELSPDQQAVYEAGRGVTRVRKVFADDWISWKNDDLVMNKISLAELAVVLERRYDVSIGFGEERLKSVSYDGALHLTNNIADILDNLEQTGNVHFVVKDKKILILPASYVR